MSKEITYISLVGGLYSRDQLIDALDHIYLLEAENEKTAAEMQPKKEWIGLNKEEVRKIFDVCEAGDRGYVMAMTEATLKEKNK